jgi:hypothetical protein
MEEWVEKDGRNETREVRILIPLVLTESNDRPINKMSAPNMKRDIRSDIVGMFTQEKKAHNIFRSQQVH